MPANRGPGWRGYVATAVCAGPLLLSACSAGAGGEPAGQQPLPPQTSAASSPAQSPAITPSAAASPAATASSVAPKPAPLNPVSLQALMAQQYNGHGLRTVRVLARTSSYTRYAIRYESGRFTISGVMNVPRGSGPFPVLILNHGHIDPAVYRNGQGLIREQGYLAGAGFVVLHTDYRNHAQSDDDPASEVRLRLGYTEDAINAVMAVKRSTFPFLDKERIGMLGRSMGGGVTLNAIVVAPALVDAAVVYASVSSNTVDNFNRWIRGASGESTLSRRINAAYGSPEQNPGFWRNVSPRTFFNRVQVPVLFHHGTSDDICPISWTRTSVAALRSAGKQVSLYTYPGEEHAFTPQWELSIRRTAAFFKEHLRA